MNQVRERAFGDSSNNSSATGAALTDAILEERRLELMGEGHRFFDLVRTGRAAQAINGFVPGKHDLFPIPIVAIDQSQGVITQNSGY